MPGENVLDWSVTAANNGNADSSIIWSEGQARASVNNSSRSEMAAIAKWRNLQNGSITTGGSANAQTFTSGVGFTGSMPAGLIVLLKIGVSNTGPVTLNMDALGPVPIKDQVGDELATEALIINGFAHLIYNGTNWVLLYSRPNFSASAVTLQTFTSSGTYVPTPGTQFVIIECVGGGGGGGGATSTGANQYLNGGGGGSGGYSRSVLTAAQIGGSQTVTIGAGGGAGIGSSGTAGITGGDTSFGSLIVAKGGSGGTSAVLGLGNCGVGGAGGIPGTGNLTAAGSPGGQGFYNDFPVSYGVHIFQGGGEGGSSFFGGGATSVFPPSSGPVLSGTGALSYGSGGGGAFAGTATGTVNGGAGSDGILIVTEFNIAVSGPAGPVGPPGVAGGLLTQLPPHGRLTLQSGAPVMTTTQSGKTTIYYSPYCGCMVPIYDGATWTSTIFAELSVLTSDTTKSPAAIGASKVNDWYVWNDAGTLRLSHGPDWSNDTTRAATLTRLNGLWVNTAAITNGPGINLGTYVGTTRSNASSQLDWIYGGLAAGGTAGFFGVWNCYNRRYIASQTAQPGTWTYATAAWRQANGSASMQCSFIRGLDEDAISAKYAQSLACLGATIAVGVGLDTTTNYTGTNTFGTTANVITPSLAEYSGLPGIGFHFVSANEYGGAGSFYGDGGAPTVYQSGLRVVLWA